MRNRSTGLIGGMLIAAALVLAMAAAAYAQTQPTPGPGGMMGSGENGAGMMGPGGMMGSSAQQGAALGSLDAAKQAIQAYVERTGNQDLALDEVMQFQWTYYAIVKEKDSGSGAFELLADPRTGAVFPEMGPNIMWNTKYSPMATNGGGMMGGLGGFAPGGMRSGTWAPTAPAAQPTVAADQAQQINQQWLDQYQPGSEAPDSFHGYYTLHITKMGRSAACCPSTLTPVRSGSTRGTGRLSPPLRREHTDGWREVIITSRAIRPDSEPSGADSAAGAAAIDLRGDVHLGLPVLERSYVSPTCHCPGVG
jgi:hypothetical protein